MDLKIVGRVSEFLEEMSGEGRNGPWRKQDFILETEGDYPAKICITQWGDDIEKFALAEGERVTVSVDIKSREYNGRWYTDVKAWRISKEEDAGGGTGGGPGGQGGGSGAAAQAPAQQPAPPLSEYESLEDEEDLPF